MQIIILNENNISYDISKSTTTASRGTSKIKRGKSPLLYYSNSTSTFNLVLSGDVELNPGPGLPPPKCQTCEKTIKTNHNRVICTNCLDIKHAKCGNLSYQHTTQARLPRYYTCENCLYTELPFAKVHILNLSTTSFDETNITLTESSQDTHLEAIQRYSKYTTIAHLNVQSLISTIDEFNIMINKYKFDIIALTETWLKNNKYQQDYVNIEDYKSAFRNRENKKGGGVGLYIKDHLSFSVRHDLNKIEETIETLWIEVRGRNKNTSYLVDVIYQPSSVEAEKHNWLEIFDHLITEIYVKWEGPIILTGDFNINLFNETK